MTPSASLLQLSDDVDIDWTTASDEWAFFPAPAARRGRRGRLKLISSASDASRAVGDTDQNVAIRPEPAVEPAAADAAPEVVPAPEPQRFADDAVSDADVAVAEEPTTDEPLTSDDASLTFESIADAEPITPDADPITLDAEPITDDEPMRDAAPTVVDLAPVAAVTAVVETDDAVEPSVVDGPSAQSASDHIAEATDVKRSPRRPAQRKTAQRKPAARKTSGPRPSEAAERTKPDGATDRPRAARRPKTERVPVESDKPTLTTTEESPARTSTAKRVLVASMALIMIAVAAVVGFLVMRDGAPGEPRPSAVDVVSLYAQGSGGVIDGSELGFRAVFPGSPERESIRLPGPDEDTQIRYEWLSFRSGDIEFAAGRVAYPDSVDVSSASSVLRTAADSSARAQHGKVETYREMTLNGDPTAESVVSTADGSYLHTHAVLHGRTLYLLRVESKVQGQQGFDRFADSFEIL